MFARNKITFLNSHPPHAHTLMNAKIHASVRIMTSVLPIREAYDVLNCKPYKQISKRFAFSLLLLLLDAVMNSHQGTTDIMCY
jgi:hypothetical protein